MMNSAMFFASGVALKIFTHMRSVLDSACSVEDDILLHLALRQKTHMNGGKKSRHPGSNPASPTRDNGKQPLTPFGH